MWPARRRDCDKVGGRSGGIGAVAAASLPCRRALDIRLEQGKKKSHVSEGNASVREEILSDATNLQQMAAEGGGGGGEIAGPGEDEETTPGGFHQDSTGSFTKWFLCNFRKMDNLSISLFIFKANKVFI